MQHRVRTMAPSCEVIPAAVPLDIFTPVLVPLPPKRPSASVTATATMGDATSKGVSTPAKASGGGGTQAASAAAAGGGGSGKKDKAKSKSKNKKKAGEEGTATAPAAGEKGGEGKEGAAGGAGAGAEAAAAPAARVEGHPSKLDVRVGVIVKAWEHPDSEKLFCEEIDLGEVRQRVDVFTVVLIGRGGVLAVWWLSH